MFEGVPNYPTSLAFWSVVDKWKVNIFYTAPTAIRALMGAGDDFGDAHRSRARCACSARVGEPINPEAWEWYYRVVGGGRCPIVDTWWQTETGGILITPLPGATPLKPGSATLPVLRRHAGARRRRRRRSSRARLQGNLVISRQLAGPDAHGLSAITSASCRPISPPIRARYFTGDGCRRDEDGYYWITGRVDDVHQRLGPPHGHGRGRSALVSHPKVSEAAVVGYPHDIKGQGIYCLRDADGRRRRRPTALRKELVACVRKEIGADRLAGPDPVRARPAEDPLGQDHAPHPAQDRRGRVLASWATPRRSPIRRWSSDLIDNRQNQATRVGRCA